MSYTYGTQPPVIESEQILILVNDTEEPQWGPAWYFEVAYDKLVVVQEDDFPSPSNYKRNDINLRDETTKILAGKALLRRVTSLGSVTGIIPYWRHLYTSIRPAVRSCASTSAASVAMATSTGDAQGSAG